MTVAAEKTIVRESFAMLADAARHKPANRLAVERIEYVTTAQLVRDTIGMIARLPASIDGVVGMARSGLIPASVIAAHLHLPLYATACGEVASCGHGARLSPGDRRHRHLLLLDDTTMSGAQMTRALPWVKSAFPGCRVTPAAVYPTPQSRGVVAEFARELPPPHLLEWNLFNSGYVNVMVTDLDGIICEECPAAADDDGPAYGFFLENARPIQLPRRAPVYAIVTARLDKYRPQTEAWLRRWGVRYDKLVMWPEDDARGRWSVPGRVAAFKGAYYRLCGASLMVESDPIQAAWIRKVSGKLVLCPKEWR